MNKLYFIIIKVLFLFGSNNVRIKIARKLGVKIGEECRLFACDFGSEPYLISIGNNCEITYGVTFVTHDGATWIFRKDNTYSGNKFGPIIIRENCMIGIKSIILPNIEIGPNSIVGAGSVVTKNIPSNCVYAGNPAEYICNVSEYLEKCKKNDLNVPYYMSPKEKKEKLEKIFQERLS
jgi:acetyltransferase-like isoleucine patch superfamily enzyme